jgi:hypothetical protein
MSELWAVAALLGLEPQADDELIKHRGEFA